MTKSQNVQVSKGKNDGKGTGNLALRKLPIPQERLQFRGIQ